MADAIALALAQRLPATAPSTTWATLGALPAVQLGAAVSTDGTRIYATHGSNGAGSQTVAVTYTPGIGAVAATAPTVARTYLAGTWANGRHWTIGGATTGAGALAAVEAYTPAGTNGASGTWTTATSLPAARVACSAATLGTFVYVAGGSSTASAGGPAASTATATVYRYDATTLGGTWQTLSDMPAARFSGAMVAYAGKLYYIGGVSANGSSFANVLVFDPAVSTWSTLTTTGPYAGLCDRAALVGSVAYLFRSDAVVMSLDLTTMVSATATPLSASHGSSGAAVTVGSTIYVVSGSATANVDAIDPTAGTVYAAKVQALQQYLASIDPAAYAAARKVPTTAPSTGWRTLGTAPDTRNAAAVTTDGSNIFVTHGLVGSAPVATGYTVSPTTGVTTALPNDSLSRSGVASAFMGGRHYSLGGIDSTAAVVNSVRTYTPGATATGAGGTWASAGTSPFAVANASAATVGGFLYVAGGQTSTASTSVVSTVYRFDGTTWTTLTGSAMPSARTSGAMVAYAGKLYYLGGVNASSSAQVDPFIFDPTAQTWSTMATTGSAPTGAQGGAAVIGSVAYVLSANGSGFSTINLATAARGDYPSLTTAHGTYAGLVSIGTSLYVLSGSATANVDTVDISASSAYARNAATVKALAALTA